MGTMNVADRYNVGATPTEAIDQLQSFCRGEMSAVETYKQAMEATKDPQILAQLQRNLASHEERVQLLCERIRQLGGDVPEGSGPWGVFAKAVEGTASALGEKSALAALEEGEDHGLADYRADFTNLDAQSARMIADQILPAQIQTHSTLASMKRSMA